MAQLLQLLRTFILESLIYFFAFNEIINWVMGQPQGKPLFLQTTFP